MSGTIISQGITLLLVPILSRVYSPGDFGVFGIFTTMLSIVGGVGCLRYELAVVLPRSERRAAQVFILAGGVAILLAAIVLVLVIIGRNAFAGLLNAPVLATMLWWMPLSVLGLSLYQLLNYWATRHGNFRSLSVSQICRTTAVALIQIPSAKVMAGEGLVAGQLAGQWVANIALACQTLRGDNTLLHAAKRPRQIWVLAKRYRSFPIHGAPQALLNALSQSVPVLLLGWFFSPSVVGLYVMTNRVVAAPATLVSQAIRQAIMPIFAMQVNNCKPMEPVLRRYTAILGLLGLPATIAFVLSGPAIFSAIMGQRWAESGRYAGWIALWLWAGMANTPAITALTVLERQRIQLFYEALLLGARILSLASGLITHSALITIAIFSITGAAFNTAIIAIGWSTALQFDRKMAKSKLLHAVL